MSDRIMTQWGKEADTFSGMADENKQLFAEAINEIAKIYKESFNVQLFLSYGTLLGAVRENDFIGHDFDVDLSYISYEKKGHKVAEQSSVIINKLLNNEIPQIKFVKGHFSQYKISIDYRGHVFMVDIFISFFKELKFFQYFWLQGELDRDDILPLSGIEFRGVTFKSPRRPHKVLSQIYGDDWRIPNPNFKYDMSTIKYKHFKEITPRSNKGYWDKYYGRKVYKDVWSIKPSPFCEHVKNKFLNNVEAILEVGCGNGRDSYNLISECKKLTSVDYSSQGIEFCRAQAEKLKLDISFEVLNLYSVTDVLKFVKSYENVFDLIYARFLVHAITLAGELSLIRILEKTLKHDGLICLEFRTNGDSRALLGKKISDNEKEDGHYRRFIDPSLFQQRVEINECLKVDYYEVSDKYAVFGDENPEVCRMYIRKSK